jgi:hypothetical protein
MRRVPAALKAADFFKAIGNLGFAPSSTERRPAPPLLRGSRCGMHQVAAPACPDGPPRDVESGGYLLPSPTLRLRARLESGAIDVYDAAFRHGGQNIPSTVSTSG